MAEIEKPDTPTNVVDDLAKQNELIDNFVNSIKTEGNLEFYVKHSGTTVSAGDIRYNPTIGRGSQIPGFYTEPLGIRDIKVMGGRGGVDAVSNYYKVQVNSDNLLIDAVSGQVTGTQSPITGIGNMYLGDQIDKIDWNIFEQETGLNFERDFVGANKDPLIPTYEIKNGKKFTRLDVQTFITNLESKGLTGDQIASALRKSGIEGFATGPINAQYEVVLIDPNDDLGIGKKLNIEDATEVDFINNQSKVNQLDELVITSAPVVDNVVDIREMQLKKLMQEVEDATPDVIKITPSQAEMIDNALADAAAKMNRSTFEVIEGGIGRKITTQEILQIAGKRLSKLFVDGITLIDIYELGLLAYAFGEPIVELVTKLIYPDYNSNDYTYGEQVMQNFEVITKISPTDRLLMKAADEIEEKFGFRPGDVSKEIFSEDTSPVRPVLFSSDTNREIPLESYVPKTIYDITKKRFQPDTLEEKTSYGEYKQFLSGLNGMIGG